MPMQVIGVLLGIPEEHQEAVRDYAIKQVQTDEGKPTRAASDDIEIGQIFADYIDWRARHPSDDITTEPPPG